MSSSDGQQPASSVLRHLAAHSTMTASRSDVLSEPLRIAHLSGSVSLAARLAAPWRYRFPGLRAGDTPHGAPGERLVAFYLIAEGECFVHVAGAAPARLVAGDAALLPDAQSHWLCSSPDAPVADDAPMQASRRALPVCLEHDGPGLLSRVIGGQLACDRRLAGMLLGGLPSIVQLRVLDAGATSWLESGFRHALAETLAARPGGAALLGKLAELLFVEIIRRYVGHAAPGPMPTPYGRTGWLAGLNDRVVGSALEALHRQPAHAWTLDELARAASTSRSVLAERFQHLVGSPPMQYLTQWRMMMAANLLARTNAPLIRIAEDVGYKTDSAFSKAFRREYGAPPAAWRRRQATRSAATPDA